METTVARDAAADTVEAVYRREGGRLGRALQAFTGDADIAAEAMAEAFAQALRRGPAIRDVSAWVWRSAFRMAAADLKQRSQLIHGPVPDGSTYDPRLDDELLQAPQREPRPGRVLDCSVREIGRLTGMNVLAVRSHLSRGRKRLRELLGAEHV